MKSLNLILSPLTEGEKQLLKVSTFSVSLKFNHINNI